MEEVEFFYYWGMFVTFLILMTPTAIVIAGIFYLIYNGIKNVIDFFKKLIKL